MTTRFEIVLFDLGGVIIDLSGLDRFLHRHALPTEEFWPRWLGLGAGHDFERGLTSPADFADAFIREFDLAIGPEQFLDEFAAWPSGLLPGAAELVTDVPLATATLSNTNAVHWATDLEGSLVGELFDRHFLSFQLGVAKPSPRIYERVTQLLGVAPETICFVDDNALNVAAARDAGWTAKHVAGPAGARAALTALGILD